MKSLKSSSREIAVVFPEVTDDVIEAAVVETEAAVIEEDSSSDVDNKSLSKVSSLLFRSPFDFLLKGLENLDKHLDDEDVDEIVEVLLELLEQLAGSM